MNPSHTTAGDTLSPATHDEVWLLLPWYINETLSEDEHRQVAEHLTVCIPCRSELEAQQAICKAVQDSPVEGLCQSVQYDQLMSRIRGAEPPVVPLAEAADRRDRRRQRTVWGRPWGQIAAVAAALVAIVTVPLTGLLTPEDTTFHTLSASQGDGPAPVTQVGDLRVIFDRSLTAGQRVALLDNVNGRVIQPADAHGVYVIRLGDGQTLAPEQFARTVDQLRQDPLVVFAEPVYRPQIDRSDISKSRSNDGSQGGQLR